jgi:hypothetical protein
MDRSVESDDIHKRIDIFAVQLLKFDVGEGLNDRPDRALLK